VDDSLWPRSPTPATAGTTKDAFETALPALAERLWLSRLHRSRSFRPRAQGLQRKPEERGWEAGSAVTTANSVICIGANVDGENVSYSCYIGQIYSNVQPQVGIDPDLVTINSDGRLGRANVSSRRYKHDIKPMDKASETIYALKPVTFRYHEQYDSTQTVAFGLIAEEVAEGGSSSGRPHPDGQPESVRYEQINAMLLNEFLKERAKVEEQNCKIQQQESTIAELQNGITTLIARIEEQDVRIQRVSAQMEMGSADARTFVVENQ